MNLQKRKYEFIIQNITKYIIHVQRSYSISVLFHFG